MPAGLSNLGTGRERRIEMMSTDRFFDTWRVKWYPRIVLISMLVGILVVVLSGKGAESLTGRLGGDYPAFYAAGRIASQGDWEHLYSFARQEAVQKDLLPTESKGAFLPFPYPPFVALLYCPLALLNFRLSYLIHTLLMFLAIAIALRLLSRGNPYIATYYDLALAATLLYYPMLRAVLGGQNTPITFLLVVAVWRAGLDRREWLAGFFLGLMLFKPQFGLPLIGLHFLSGRWRTVISSALVALGLYLIGSYLCGAGWIREWLRFGTQFANLDASINRSNSVSWLGFLQALLGVDSRIVLISGWGLAIATSLATSLLWYRGRLNDDLSAHLGLTVIALVLIQPHAMYYDMALVLFTYVLYLSYDKTTTKVIGLIWLLSLSQVAAKTVGFSPLFVLLLWSGLMAIFLMWRQPHKPDGCFVGVKKEHEKGACIHDQ
jgi:hypothetical protein